MPIKDTIAKLDELRGSATQGEYANWEGYRLMALEESHGGGCALIGDGMKEKDIVYIATLHNSYEALRRVALAGEALAEAIEEARKSMEGYGDSEYAAFNSVYEALKTYRKAIEE